MIFGMPYSPARLSTIVTTKMMSATLMLIVTLQPYELFFNVYRRMFPRCMPQSAGAARHFTLQDT